MVKSLSSRLQLTHAYLASQRDFPVKLLDIVKGTFKATCTKIGPRYIENITDENDKRVVKIKGISRPLCWPSKLPSFDLYKVVTECFYEDDWHFYEVPETRVEHGDVVLDCGAAEGIFALRVHERAGMIGIFEPLPLFEKSLRCTFAGSSKVMIVPAALGDTVGEAYFEGTSLYGRITDKPTDIKIPITTIDSWAEQNDTCIDFIKGDLEGFEMNVLRGAAKVIARDKPKIAMTMYHPENNWTEALAFVRNLAPSYQYRLKGLAYSGETAHPVMIHLWHPK